MKGDNLAGHILPTSATMVGVCMTVISIVKLTHPSGVGTVIDKILAIDSLLFLVSGICSFISVRATSRLVELEVLGENIFLAGLTTLATGSVLLAFEIL